MAALRPTATYQSKERVGMHVHSFTLSLVLTDGTLAPLSTGEPIVTRISSTSSPSAPYMGSTTPRRGQLWSLTPPIVSRMMGLQNQDSNFHRAQTQWCTPVLSFPGSPNVWWTQYWQTRYWQATMWVLMSSATALGISKPGRQFTIKDYMVLSLSQKGSRLRPIADFCSASCSTPQFWYPIIQVKLQIWQHTVYP